MKGAKLNDIPFDAYTLHPQKELQVIYSPCPSKNIADSFMDSARSSQNVFNIDDIFLQKLTLTQDRTYLIINEIMEKDALHKSNLARLYDDLFMVDKWREQRPHPENYLKDKTWMEFNKMELQIRDQIRRELKDAIKSVSFNEKDLRESLLDFKKQSQKNQMMGSILEDTIQDHEKKEGNNTYNITGDTYRI
jgi:hypothetical protein